MRLGESLLVHAHELLEVLLDQPEERRLPDAAGTPAHRSPRHPNCRSLPDDGNRSEFLIFYIEPMADLGIALKDVSENQDSEREKQLLAAARERALKAFSITKN